MKRLIRKSSIIIIACILALNFAARNTAAAEAAPCLAHLSCGGPLDMGHHNGMINFAFPMQGCCEGCDDIFCDLLKDPLKDINAINSSPARGAYCPVILGTVISVDKTRSTATVFGLLQAPPGFWALNQIPLYLEHLSLII